MEPPSMDEPEAPHAEPGPCLQPEPLEVVPDPHPVPVDELGAPLRRHVGEREVGVDAPAEARPGFEDADAEPGVHQATRRDQAGDPRAHDHDFDIGGQGRSLNCSYSRVWRVSSDCGAPSMKTWVTETRGSMMSPRGDEEVGVLAHGQGAHAVGHAEDLGGGEGDGAEGRCPRAGRRRGPWPLRRAGCGTCEASSETIAKRTPAACSFAALA